MLLRRHSLCARLFVRVSGRPGEAALLQWMLWGGEYLFAGMVGNSGLSGHRRERLPYCFGRGGAAEGKV
jgi:hypothetical protein